MARLALMFRLPKGRFIVGYALGDDGMLVQGRVDRRLRPKTKLGVIA